MHTVTVTKATLVEVKEEGSGPASTTIGATLLDDVVGFTVTVADPVLEVSCVEVALTETWVLELTMGAVSSPEAEMEPALVLQVTAVLKLPVPVTVAEHWLVWPEETVEGEQLTVTPVMVEVGVDPPPPPQAAMRTTLAATSNIANLRMITNLSPSADIAGLNALGHELGNVGLAVEAAHVPGLREHDAGGGDIDRTAALAGGLLAAGLPRCSLLRQRLLHLLVIRSEQLLEIGRELAFPSHGKDSPGRGDVLPHLGAVRGGDLVHDV